MSYIESNVDVLPSLYEWSKRKALKYTVSGQLGPIDDGLKPSAPYIPSCYGGYRTRTAFYIRDYVHQAKGAALLGLHEENYRMMKAFVDSATPERKHFALWAINFDGVTPYHMDYKSDSDFIREIPSQYELVECIYDLYLMTGDERYLSDSFFNFCTNIMVTMTEMLDSDGNGVPEGQFNVEGESNIYATYDERDHVNLSEAGDCIACQHRAMLAYSGLFAARGDKDSAELWKAKADELRRYFLEEWSIDQSPSDHYVYAIDVDGIKHSGYKVETSYFMPLKRLLPRCERTDRFLDLINEIQGRGIGGKDASNNIEAYTYFPQLYFNYGRVEDGWRWMKYIISKWHDNHESVRQGPNCYYPELSFTFISNVICGLMGVTANVPSRTIETVSRLPQEIKYLTVEDVRLGGNTLEIMHYGRSISSVKSFKGEDFTWRAKFAGEHREIIVNTTPYPATIVHEEGGVFSYVDISVGRGMTVTAKVEE